MSEPNLPAPAAATPPSTHITRNQIDPITRMQLALQYGAMMAKSRGIVPRQFEGNEGTCTAIAEQAIVWNMAPNMLAQMAYVMPESGRLGYEAKAIAAACYSTGATTDPLEIELIGDWSVLRGYPPVKGTGKNGGDRWSKGWPDDKEAGLGIRVKGVLATNGRQYTIDVYFSTITVRNSPLWATDPVAQLTYQAAVRWVRQRAPWVLVGVQLSDDHRDARDMGAAEILSERGAQMTPMEKLDTALAPIKARITGEAPPPSVTEVLGAFSKASSRNELEHALQLAAQLPEGVDKDKARAAYSARVAELKGKPAQTTQDAAPSSSEPSGQADELEPHATSGEPPALTYAEVRDRLQHAGTVEALDEAADLIGSIANPEHREELVALYHSLKGE